MSIGKYVEHLGNLTETVDHILHKIEEEEIISRIWQHDYTVWKEKPDEIANRLGWLHAPENMVPNLPTIYSFVDEIRSEKFKNAVLLGMGGSSLAPEVFQKIFGVKPGFINLAVLDSTHPTVITEYFDRYQPEETLYIVSTKSGGTVETISLMKYFYTSIQKVLGMAQVAKHFIAITDPGSGLEEMARQLNFRKIFLNDPNIGGRYSALTYFGLVPAALLGIDLDRLLHNAREMSQNCKNSEFLSGTGNPAARLGAVMAAAAEKGRDKMTFFLSPSLKPFAAWNEQLIAESTGKEGKGILPVLDAKVMKMDHYSSDRWFAFFRLGQDENLIRLISKIRKTAHPFIEIQLNDVYDLGAEFFRWEMATAIAGWSMKINPFDQPNVESSKILARKMVQSYRTTGKLPQMNATVKAGNLQVYTFTPGKTLEEILLNYFPPESKELEKTTLPSYISIHAYLSPHPQLDVLLQKLQDTLAKKYRLSVTLGYGPRFLHSTGQLHKGDSGKGLFIQLSADIDQDLPIPDRAGEDQSAISFGTLITSQYLGDFQALHDGGRRVLRIHLGKKPLIELKKIIKIINSL